MGIEDEMRPARFAQCRPNLRLRKKGTKFDTYQCADCKKLWSIPKYKPQRSES